MRAADVHMHAMHARRACARTWAEAAGALRHSSSTGRRTRRSWRRVWRDDPAGPYRAVRRPGYRHASTGRHAHACTGGSRVLRTRVRWTRGWWPRGRWTRGWWTRGLLGGVLHRLRQWRRHLNQLAQSLLERTPLRENELGPVAWQVGWRPAASERGAWRRARGSRGSSSRRGPRRLARSRREAAGRGDWSVEGTAWRPISE